MRLRAAARLWQISCTTPSKFDPASAKSFARGWGSGQLDGGLIDKGDLQLSLQMAVLAHLPRAEKLEFRPALAKFRARPTWRGASRATSPSRPTPVSARVPVSNQGLQSSEVTSTASFHNTCTQHPRPNRNPVKSWRALLLTERTSADVLLGVGYNNPFSPPFQHPDTPCLYNDYNRYWLLQSTLAPSRPWNTAPTKPPRLDSRSDLVGFWLSFIQLLPSSRAFSFRCQILKKRSIPPRQHGRN